MINYKSRVIFFLFLIPITIVSTYCGKEEIPKSTLVVKDNLLYKQGSNVPFTGHERALVENKIIEYDVKDGLKHGDFKIFSEEGILEIQGQIDSNRNVGKWQYFYQNGEIESEGYFVNDMPDGRWIWNYPDGKKKEEGYYNKGKRIGLWYGYDKTGNIVFENNYDLEDSTKVQDKDSKIID
jgi:antitoxin component YwqK of YwqJK toxin-antitoxin module